MKEIGRTSCENEIRAAYWTGILLFTVGMAICLHDLMILVLGRVEKPDSITVLIPFVVLGVNYRQLQ